MVRIGLDYHVNRSGAGHRARIRGSRVQFEPFNETETSRRGCQQRRGRAARVRELAGRTAGAARVVIGLNADGSGGNWSRLLVGITGVNGERVVLGINSQWCEPEQPAGDGKSWQNN